MSRFAVVSDTRNSVQMSREESLNPRCKPTKNHCCLSLGFAPTEFNGTFIGTFLPPLFWVNLRPFKTSKASNRSEPPTCCKTSRRMLGEMRARISRCVEESVFRPADAPHATAGGLRASGLSPYPSAFSSRIQEQPTGDFHELVLEMAHMDGD
jgi:hypothetical protein